MDPIADEGLICVLRVTLLAGTQGGSYPGSIGPETAVLTEPAENGSSQSVTIAAGGAATRLARIVGLGPRPRRPEPELVEVALDRLERHLSRQEPIDADQARTDLELPPEAPGDFAEAIGALGGSVLGHWRLEVDDAITKEPVALLEVVDAGDRGYWQVLPTAEPGRVLLASSSSTVIWSELVAAVTATLGPRVAA
jgi:hypothetical protein